MNKDNIFRFDFIFSYWIFAWYLLFIFNFVKYNPKLALIFALIINCCIILILFYYNFSFYNIAIFVIIQICIKIIPIWTLRNSNVYDFKSIIILYIIYSIWLFINNTNIYELYKTQLDYIKQNKGFGPASKIINKLFK